MTFLLFSLLAGSRLAESAEPVAASAPETATVVSVYDGDTMTLGTGDKVRLRLVNTPELRPLEPYGLEARATTTAFAAGKTATLGYGATERDGYGRLLASITVDGQGLAEHLLDRGMGHLFVIPPDQTDLGPLLAAQERARAAKRGIWSTAMFQGAMHITSFHANADGDDRTNVNGEYLRICNLTPDAIDMAGWRLADINGNSWEFPQIIVPPGHTVKAHSGRGPDQKDPEAQLEVYLQSMDPIWNNKEDRATLYDRYGRVVDTRAHQVSTDTP